MEIVSLSAASPPGTPAVCRRKVLQPSSAEVWLSCESLQKSFGKKGRAPPGFKSKSQEPLARNYMPACCCL